MSAAVARRRRTIPTRPAAGLLALVLCVAGCTQQGGPNSPPPPDRSKPAVIETPTIVVSPSSVEDVDEVLTRADAAFQREEYEAAAEDYERVLNHATDEPRRLRALLGFATSLDLGGKPGPALSAYSRYVAEAPPGDKTEAIRVRKVRLLVYLEKYEEAGHESAHMDLGSHTTLGQVALLAARALGEIEAGRIEAADRHVIRGRALIEAHALSRVDVPPLDVAALFFAQGEIARMRAEGIAFDPIPTDFNVALERRCQFILDAQGSYSEAMRSQDAHYSSMSGVKVGRLYQALHTDLTSMPTPASATTPEKKALFEGAMRLRYSILLRKAAAMLRATVALMERSNQPSRWRQEARAALQQIENAEKQEQAALDALPYTREQLQQVLDDMAARARASTPK